MLSVGTIINGAMRQIREHPLAMLVWGLLYMGLTAAGMIAFFVPFFQVFAMSATGGAPPDPAAMMGMIGEIYLFDFVILLLFAVLMTAGLRAALRPEAGAFAYLRLGMDELRQIGLSLLIFIGIMIVTVIMAMILGIALAALGMATGGTGGRAPVAAVLLMLLIYIPPIYLIVRLSLAFPLTMLRGRFTIGEAWTLSGGRFWTLFGGYLVVALMFFVVYMAAGMIFIMTASAMTQVTGPLAIFALMQGHPGGATLALLIAGGIVLAVFSGAYIAALSGAVMAATRALLGHDGVDLEETFA